MNTCKLLLCVSLTDQSRIWPHTCLHSSKPGHAVSGTYTAPQQASVWNVWFKLQAANSRPPPMPIADVGTAWQQVQDLCAGGGGGMKGGGGRPVCMLCYEA